MSKAEKKPATVLSVHRPEDLKGENKIIGGSMSDRWNHVIAVQVVNTLWTKHLDDDETNRRRQALQPYRRLWTGGAIRSADGCGPFD
jgi:hypothetical protein